MLEYYVQVIRIGINDPIQCYSTESSSDYYSNKLTYFSVKLLGHTICEGDDEQNIKSDKLRTYPEALKLCGSRGLANPNITKINNTDYRQFYFTTRSVK